MHYHGSQIISLRIPPLFLSAIDGAIKNANKKRRRHPYTRSTWILKACSEKLDHGLRSGKKKEPVQSE